MIVRKNKKHDSPKKIALLGIRPRVGVTHTGILIGEFLKEHIGAKVAFIEKNYHGDIEQLGNAVYGSSKPMFTFRGIDCYPINQEGELQKNNKKYDYLILDFGTQKKKNLKELEQCEKKVIIGTLNLWEWQEYVRVAKQYKENMAGEAIEYMVSLGDKRLIPKVEKQLQHRVYFLGPQPIDKTLREAAEPFFDTLV